MRKTSNRSDYPLAAFEEGLVNYMRDELDATIAELMGIEYNPEQYDEADAFDCWDQYINAMDDDINSGIDSYPQPQSRGRQERRKQTFKHEARRMIIAQNSDYTCGVWLNNYANPTHLHRKHKSGREGFFKRVSNKRWRKVAHDVITNTPSEYRKVFDYAWEID